MAVAFGTIASGSNNAAAKASSTTVPWPTSNAAGDYILAVGGNTSPDPPATTGGFTTLNAGAPANSDVQGAVFGQLLTAAQTGSTTQSGPTVNTCIGGANVRYIGASDTPRTTTRAVSASVSTTSPAMTLPTGTTTTDMVIAVYVYGDDTSRAANTKQTVTTTNLTNASWNIRLTLQVASSTSSQFPLNIVIADKLGATAAPPTITCGATGGWNCFCIALPQAAAAAAPTNAFFFQ